MKRKKAMPVIIIIICIILVVVIWFKIPFSPLKSDFKSDVEKLNSDSIIFSKGEVFEESDFTNMPVAVQRYIEGCGYIGKLKMNYICMEYHDVNFKQGRTGPNLKMDYTQYDYVKKPARRALIESSMFGIPFQGYDYYSDGTGGMKGVIAKVITLFDQRGSEMDQACLATLLAESMFAPSLLLQDYIELEGIDDYHVKATITYKNQTATGVFTFNANYEMVSFSTNDRAVVGNDGSVEYVKWTAECGDYVTGLNGIKQPSTFKAIWNYPDEDFVYFDGNISDIWYK